MRLHVSQSDVEATKQLVRRSSFFDKLECRFSLKMPQEVRNVLARAIVDYVHELHENSVEIVRKQQKAIAAVAKPLRAAVDALNRQKSLPEDAPDREGFRRFQEWADDTKLSCFSDGTSTIKLLEADRLESKARRRKPAKRVPIATFSIGLVDLERLATAMSELDRYPLKKSVRRESLLLDLAEVFHASGGRVAASYKPQIQRVDGPLIRFVRAIIEELPRSVSEYLKPDLAEAMRRLLRQIDWSNNQLAVSRSLYFDAGKGRFRVSGFGYLHLKAQLKEHGIDLDSAGRSDASVDMRKPHKPKNLRRGK